MLKCSLCSSWQSKDLGCTWLGRWCEAVPHCDSECGGVRRGWGLGFADSWCEPDSLWTSLGHGASGTWDTHVFIIPGLSCCPPRTLEILRDRVSFGKNGPSCSALDLILLFSELPWSRCISAHPSSSSHGPSIRTYTSPPPHSLRPHSTPLKLQLLPV